MSFSKKRVAIIGGGISGLNSIIMLKEENIEPVCFEKTDKLGGTWCYREKPRIGEPSIMPTTILNHSKELGAFSNFPPDKKYNNFMKHNEVYEHLMNYSRNNDILKYIKFNSEVVAVRKALDYEETGQWIVTVGNTLTDSESHDVYDAVIVCTGHINVPKYPEYKGQNKFKGSIIHTHNLKGVSPYTNKRVVVVGMGCSGLDAAVEISNVALKVYLSTRSGAHVLTRFGPEGYPVDYVMLRRYLTILLDLLPTNLVSWGFENLTINPNFNPELYAIKPKRPLFSNDPSVNDYLASKLLTGAIIQKPDIKEFVENGVIFEGDSEITEADTVIMATGYDIKFPFLEKELLLCESDDQTNLYKCIWPPNLKHSTLAFIGFFLPFGPGFPISEMQCRYVVHILARKGNLPLKEEMLKDIRKRIKKNKARFGKKEKQSFRVDYVQYLDELAEIIGAKPNFFKMFFSDPTLFFKLVFGPSVPYQYRLKGPHPWNGAREAIMTCHERVLYPLKRSNRNISESFFKKLMKKFVIWFLSNFLNI